MLRGLASHEHRTGDVGGKNRIKTRTIHIDELFEHTEACIVHENVQVTERLQNLAIGAYHIRVAGNVSPNRQRF